MEGLIDLSLNGTWTNATKESEDYPRDPTSGKELIYVPRQAVRIALTIRTGSTTVFVEHAWSSYRFTTEVNDRFLPSYGITSGAIRQDVSVNDIRFWLKAEGTNLFNTSYQLIALYPMPLREFRVTAGVGL
jgi:hypothetical protein